MCCHALFKNIIPIEHGDLFLFKPENDWKNDKSQQGIIGFYKGTFVFSNDQESAISAMDQLTEESNTGELKETLADPFYRMSRKGSLAYGVMNGSFFKNPDIGTGPFKTISRAEIKKAVISLDHLSGENGTLSLNVDWSSNEFAAKANEEIKKLKPEWIKKAEQNGFDMEVLNSLKDEKLDIQFQVSNLFKTLIALSLNNIIFSSVKSYCILSFHF